jgi:hypothetical protein
MRNKSGKHHDKWPGAIICTMISGLEPKRLESLPVSTDRLINTNVTRNHNTKPNGKPNEERSMDQRGTRRVCVVAGCAHLLCAGAALKRASWISSMSQIEKD